MNKSDITESYMDILPGFLSQVHYLMSERPSMPQITIKNIMFSIVTESTLLMSHI